MPLYRTRCQPPPARWEAVMARQQTAAPEKSDETANLRCPICNSAMHLRQVAVLNSGDEQRSFVCKQCGRWDNIVFFKFDQLTDA